MIFKMIDKLLRSMSVDQLESDPSWNRMPFKVEKSIEIMSLFPSFSSQLHALLDDPRIVTWAYNILYDKNEYILQYS